MRYTGIQPQYFPRLHYFARIINTDIFMIRDDAQFVIKHKYPDGRIDKSYQAHTPIKQSFGRYLLSVPTNHHGFPPLSATKIASDWGWAKDHLKTLKFCYSQSANFKEIYPEIETILNRQYASLADLNTITIIWSILHLLGESARPDKLTLEFINSKLNKQKSVRLKQIKKASESQSLKTNKKLDANEKIVALCREVGANEDYCGGTGVAAYVDHDIFAKNGIKITVQDWKCQDYPQLFTKQQGFIPNLSIIDLFMNMPLDEAQSIIKG